MEAQLGSASAKVLGRILWQRIPAQILPIAEVCEPQSSTLGSFSTATRKSTPHIAQNILCSHSSSLAQHDGPGHQCSIVVKRQSPLTNRKNVFKGASSTSPQSKSESDWTRHCRRLSVARAHSKFRARNSGGGGALCRRRPARRTARAPPCITNA